MTIGKFTFTWKFTQLEDRRSPAVLIDQAVALGLGMVALKIADGAATSDGSGSDAQMRWYVDQLHKRGIQVWGWQYLYGGRSMVRNASGAITGSTENTYSTPEREAAVAVAQVKAYGLDGYIMDPEAEYKTAPRGRAGSFVTKVRAGLGSSVPIALCSYRYPNVHPELPWAEFLAESNYHMPQVYWGHGQHKDGLVNGTFLSAVELETSVKQLRMFKNIPFLPVGRAYIGDGHANPRPEEITAFFERARRFGFEGAGFWNWDSLRPSYPGAAGRLAAVQAYAWPGTIPPPPPPPPPPLPLEPVIDELTVYTEVNVRKDPNTSSSGNVVGKLPAGTKIQVLDYERVGAYLMARHAAGWSAVYQIGREYMR